MSNSDTVLIYAINRTDAWWKHVGENLGFARNVVVTDIRGAGDCDVVSDFYAAFARQNHGGDIKTRELSAAEVTDIVARCRLLRWLPARQARCMVAAMEDAFGALLDREKPKVVLSFPIDRYVSDVLARLAAKRGVPYIELTVSLISGMCMLMYRGQLIKAGKAPTAEEVQTHVRTIADPEFTPEYVSRTTRYTRTRWLKTFCKFRVRGWVFKLISIAKRDPMNLHYLDAQSFLGHKPRWSDMSVLDLVNWDWRAKVEQHPKERRVFFGLQLFPEASIDYWLTNRELIDYEDLVVDAARAFSAAGWLVLVKDHPSQFGFRQRELLDRLLSLSNVLFVPYDVSGNEVVSLTGTNFTLTGTLGLQAALLGRVSITTPTYYCTPSNFLTFDHRDTVHSLPQQVDSWRPKDPLPTRQAQILTHLLEGSFEGNFFSFKRFNRDAPDPSATELARNLAPLLRTVIAKGSGG